MWVSGLFPMKMEPKAIEKTVLVTSASDHMWAVSGWVGLCERGAVFRLLQCPLTVTALGSCPGSLSAESWALSTQVPPGRSGITSAGSCPWPDPAGGGVTPGFIMVSAQVWVQKRPCPWVRKRAHTYFFSHIPLAILLEITLEIGAHLAGVLLYQVPGSDISALQQSVQVLCVSSTQQELTVVEETWECTSAENGVQKTRGVLNKPWM